MWQCDNVLFWFPVLTWCQLRINENSEWLMSELQRKQAEPWSKLGCVKTNMDCYLPKHENANVGNTYFQKEFSRLFPFGWRGHLSPNFALYSCFCAPSKWRREELFVEWTGRWDEILENALLRQLWSRANMFCTERDSVSASRESLKTIFVFLLILLDFQM